MQKALGTITGKTVRAGLKFRRQGGNTLPGLVVEKVFPAYLKKMLAQLPDGVVLITGTNGKTTTTKIVTEILKANGKKVLTNQTGSNLNRGIVSSITQYASPSGKLKQDIAVLEVDEAQARRLVAQIKPRWVVALNVSRDQLDRYGEVDTIAAYIKQAMQAATAGVITNAGDPNLIRLTRGLNVPVHYFEAAQSLSKFFPSDYDLAAVSSSVKSREKPAVTEVDIQLTDFRENLVKYKIQGQTYQSKLRLSGQHNYLNGAAALALCRQLLPRVAPSDLISQLSKIDLAFGRGEKYKFKNGAQIELVLVKNPASFTQALASYANVDDRRSTLDARNIQSPNLMIAINDNIADGRDVSWLWDVNLVPLAGQNVAITSGRRAADMALRLSYDDINANMIEPNLSKAFKTLNTQGGKSVIFATYTAMLQLYKLLSKHGERLP